MSNLTDALIAAKLVGGSGGSGGGSGLPEITTETVTVVEAQTVTGFKNAGGVYIGTGGAADFSGLSGGNLVDVVFDGVTYHTQVRSMQGLAIIGNAGIMGDAGDTGEPFALTDSYAPGTLAVITNKTGSSHTVAASASVTSPQNGSILIVDGGEWKTAAFDDLIPFTTCRVMASGDFTVPANSALSQSDLTITQTIGVPASWTIALNMAVTIATNGNHNTTDVLITNIDFDFENQLVTNVSFYNPTSSAVSFSGFIFVGGISKAA